MSAASTEPKRPHVVCVGGGWVAVKLVRAMRPALWAGKADLTVVSRNNFHTVHGLIAEMLTGKIQPHQIILPTRRVFRPARFVNAEVDAIDVAAQTVTVSRALDDRPYVLPYDHLVIGVGAVDDLSRYPGIAEHTTRLKTFWDCCQARSHLLTMLELAEIETDPAERRRLLTFVIAGGNFAGIEVACDLADYFRLLARTDYRALRPEEIRVVVVHSGPRILPELGRRLSGLVSYAERRLERLGVETRLATRVAAATPEEAVLSDGERVPTRTIISCTGVAAAPLLNALPFERDERGRLVTDACLRVAGVPDVWAAGDCAAVPHPHGGSCPQLAHYAATGGTQIGRNLRRVLAGREPRPFRFTGLGEACSLGHRCAVAHLKGVPVTGFLAWIGWRLIVLTMFMPSWGRRVRLLFDWCATPLLGREIVNPKIEEHLGIEPAMYEPGQEIVRRGDVGRLLYLIQSGEVEELGGEAGAETVARLLGPGDQFGGPAVFRTGRHPATLRARGRVHLLCVGRDVARALSEGGVHWT
jgi:NADH dehydrogenase